MLSNSVTVTAATLEAKMSELTAAKSTLAAANDKLLAAQNAAADLPDNATKKRKEAAAAQIAECQTMITNAQSAIDAAQSAIDKALADHDKALAELVHAPRTVAIGTLVTRILDLLDGFTDTLESAIVLASNKWDYVHLRAAIVGDREVWDVVPLAIDGIANVDLANQIGRRADVRYALGETHAARLNGLLSGNTDDPRSGDLIAMLDRARLMDLYAAAAWRGFYGAAAAILSGKDDQRLIDHLTFANGQFTSTIHAMAEDRARVDNSRQTSTPRGSTSTPRQSGAKVTRYRLVNRMPINMRCFNGKGYTLTIAADHAVLHRADGTVVKHMDHSGVATVANAVGVVIRAGRMEIEGIDNSRGWGIPNELGMPDANLTELVPLE